MTIRHKEQGRRLTRLALQAKLRRLAQLVLLLSALLLTGVGTTWAGVPFTAQNRITDNDGSFTSANNAGNEYALAIADLSEIAGITTGNNVKVEFDCNIPSGSRWLIGIGDKTTRGTNAYGSFKSTYNTDGLIMRFGTSDGDAYRVNGGTNNPSAFGQYVHVTVELNMSNNTYTYSYSIVNKEDPSTVYFSASNQSTSVSNLTIIEVYTWQSNATISLSDVKVNDGFFFPKGNDMMYIEDMVYYSPLDNETGRTATYTITGNDGYVRTASNASPFFPFYPIKTSGNNAISITATDGNGHSPAYSLKTGTRNSIAVSSLVSGEVFSVGNLPGQITEESVTLSTGLTLSFGNASEPQVIRNDGPKAVACIDASGWTHTYWPDWNKDKVPTKGTFFKLAIPEGSEGKTLVVNGYFASTTDEQVLLRKDNGDGTLGETVLRIPNPGDGSLASDDVKITEAGTYYLCSQTGTFSLQSLIYTNIQVTLTYPSSIDGVAFFNETLSTPTVKITDVATGQDITSHYNAPSSFTITGVGTIEASSGVVTTGTTQGKAVVHCNLTHKSAEYLDDGYKNLTGITTTLYITDGSWVMNEANFATMDNASTGLSDAQWELRNSTYHRNIKDRTADYQYIYDKSNDNLFSVTYGLKIKGNSRFNYHGHGEITMFSKPAPKASIRIPARKGMVVEITASASDEETELSIAGATDLEGNTITGHNWGTASTAAKFICNADDGYVTISNNNSALSVSILQITVTSEIVLRDGNGGDSDIIYVAKGAGSYLNEILNDEGSTFTYAETEDANNIATVNTTTGEVTLTEGYGTVKVTVTGASGQLSGKTKTYTIQTVRMAITQSSIAATLNNGTITAAYKDDLKGNVTIYTGEGTSDAGLQAKVEFSLEWKTEASTDVTVTKSGSNYVFNANGLSTVGIQARLGHVTETFTYVIQGANFAEIHPVISNDVETYDMLVAPVQGTINSITSQTIDAVYGNLNKPSVEVTTTDGKYYLHITGITAKSDPAYDDVDPFIPSSKGGAFKVSATVKYTSYDEGAVPTDLNISTVVTVAYSQHVWNFQDDMTTTLPTHGETGNILETRPQPVDKGDYTVATDPWSTWQYQKKFHSEESGGGYVYAYLKPVTGDNAAIIQPSAGLQIFAEGTVGVSSYAEYTDNGYARTGTDRGTYYEDAEGHKYSKTDTKREIVFKNGCHIVIPKLKAGQQIDLYWHRHSDDQGERLRMKNLCDASGEEITDIYKIAFTGTGHTDKQPTGAGSYSFIVKADGDVEISSVDGTWTRIHEIVLWDKPINNYDDTQSTYKSTMENMDASRYLHVDDDNSFTIDMNEATWQLNVHNGGSPTYTISQDQTLGATVDMSSGHPVFHYNNGWGKLYVTLSNCTQDGKYISTWKNYTITVGKKPGQTYPYTWDFTKYRQNTKTTIKNSDKAEHSITIKVRDDKTRTVTRSTETWSVSGADYSAKTTGYGGSMYESYFVDGAQLVSQALSGPLPETEGLGFNLNSSSVSKATLTLDMTDDVNNSSMEAVQTSGSSYHTWQSGKLTIGAGGQLIVPTPGDDYADYYIYIKSSSKPTVTNTVDKSTDDDVIAAKGQYKYQFSANASAVMTFAEEATVEAIAVTNEFKTMTPLSGTAWATESRSHAVDYTLDSLLTINPIHAYAIIERSGNPKYSDDKTKTVVAVNDRRHVVPANNGLVLKQTTNVPALVAPATTYQVPLFAPAVTTAEDAGYRFTGNLMRPCVSGKPFMSETENLDGTDYTVFILANKYMTWKKEGTSAVTTDNSWHSGNVAAFYRLHKYGDDATNTLGRNKAYLLLRTDKINGPIWESSPASPAPRYVGIAGVSDMEEEQTAAGIDQGDGRTYNLRGQAVDGESLSPGIYIKNGKKIVMK